jgi:hypothetical protein
MKRLSTQADTLTVRARRLLSDHRTRAKKDGIALDYGIAEVRQLLADNPLCEYCRMPLSFAASIDHRQPIRKGRRHVLHRISANFVDCKVLEAPFNPDREKKFSR